MFGIQCYSTEGEGFTGKIKQFCEDFAVTEINERGELTELTTRVLPPVLNLDPKPKHLASGLKEELQKCDTCNSTDSKDNHKPHVPGALCSGMDEMVSPDHHLKRLLGDSKLAELCRFADSKFTENGQEMKQDLILGSFNNKEDRAAVHVNVRKKFPFLKTCTKSAKKEDTKSTEIFATFDTIYQEFLSLLEDKDDVNRLFLFAHSTNKKSGQTHSLKPDSDRSHRTLVHRLIAKHYGSFLESKTFSEEHQGETVSFIQIRVRFKAAKTSKEKMAHERSEEKSKYCYTGFVLWKKNKETLEAIQQLSKRLKTHPSAFSYAGIKDKKAVTQQYMLVRGVSPEQLAQIQENSILKGINTGNYERNIPGPLKLGALQGNRFRIVIRNLQPTTDSRNETLEEKVKESMFNLSQNGFVNYYGQQRFGLESNLVNSHDIGLALLQGDFVRAVSLLLTPSGRQPEDQVDSAKRYYTETKDIPGTLSKMPEYKTRECLILRSLRRHGNTMEGCTKAFMNLPFSSRLLYVHSYCSLLWNHTATWRLKMNNSMEVTEGDLVVDREFCQTSLGQDESLPVPKINIEEKPKDDGRLGTEPLREVSTHTESMTSSQSPSQYSISSFIEQQAASNEPDADVVNQQRDYSVLGGGISKSHVKVVNSRDVTLRKYSLRDIVLPMVGHSTIYPDNEVGERLSISIMLVACFDLQSLSFLTTSHKRYAYTLLYVSLGLKERLAVDSLTGESFRVRSLGLNVPGAYRKLIGYPKNLEWKLVPSVNQGSQTPPIPTSECLRVAADYKTEPEGGTGPLSQPQLKKQKLDEEIYCSDASSITDQSLVEAKQKDCKNLEVSFCLDPSCYATVCLRELMKS